jgi:hypothetical protein
MKLAHCSDDALLGLLVQVRVHRQADDLASKEFGHRE